MTNRPASLLLAALLVGIGAAPRARADDSATDTRQTIQTELNRMDAAFARKDGKGAFAFYAPDYHRTDQIGKSYGLESDRKNALQLFPVMKSVHGVNTVENVVVRGTSATVNVTTRGHIVLQPANSKKTIEADDLERRLQTWTKSGPRWMLEKSRTVSSKQTVSRQRQDDRDRQRQTTEVVARQNDRCRLLKISMSSKTPSNGGYKRSA